MRETRRRARRGRGFRRSFSAPAAVNPAGEKNKGEKVFYLKLDVKKEKVKVLLEIHKVFTIKLLTNRRFESIIKP